MKRKLAMLLVLLCGGAIINIAAAWGLIIWMPTDGGGSSNDVASLELLEEHRNPKVPAFANKGLHEFGWEESQVRTSWRDNAVETHRELWLYGFIDPQSSIQNRFTPIGLQVAGGWPLRCVVGERWYRKLEFSQGLVKPHCIMSVDATTWPLGKVPKTVRLLPLKPLWPGFAINTIFYAAILWLLFAAPGFMRRRYRIKRGLCPSCAYPVGASDVCTECGRPRQEKQQ